MKIIPLNYNIIVQNTSLNISRQNTDVHRERSEILEYSYHHSAMLRNHIKTISHFRFFLLRAKMLRLKYIILTLCKQVKDLTEKRDIINKCTMSLF